MGLAIIILAVWLAAALAAVASGGLERVMPPMIAATLASLCVLIGLRVRALREWIRTCDVRLLLLPHLCRYVGLVFLVLIARGKLAEAFRPIGIGDALAALGATTLLFVPSSKLEGPYRRWLLLWNTFGLLDMGLLVATGIRLASIDPAQFQLFRAMPFGLLPAFVVPLVIATHMFIFWRSLDARKYS